MPKTILPIANGFYVSDSLPISAQECVNFFPVTEDAPSINQETLRGSPGLEQVATTGTSSSDANRGSQLKNGKPFFVNGTTLYRLNSDHTVDALGTISGTGPVSMADNGTQLMILDSENDAYIFTTGPDTLTQITDADFTANGLPRVVVFIDGYFCCTTNQKKYIVSALNDGLSWNALDFGSAETEPDALLAPIVYKNQLFIGGTRTIEAFTNTGSAGFPFTRSGLFVDQGLASRFCVGSGPDVFIFVGKDSRETPAVWSFYGNSTTKVSTLGIDLILGGLTQSERGSITSWSYGQNGHYFVGFVLPETTIVYDIFTSKWHERKSRLVTNGLETIYPWRAVNMVYAYGEMFAGDALDGHIGRVSQNLKDEYSYEIVRTFATQPFQNNMDPFFVPMIELTIEQGTGIASAGDVDDGQLQPTCSVYECDAFYDGLAATVSDMWPCDDPIGTTQLRNATGGDTLGIINTPEFEYASILPDTCTGVTSIRMIGNDRLRIDHLARITGTVGSIGGLLDYATWGMSISRIDFHNAGGVCNIDMNLISPTTIRIHLSSATENQDDEDYLNAWPDDGRHFIFVNFNLEVGGNYTVELFVDFISQGVRTGNLDGGFGVQSSPGLQFGNQVDCNYQYLFYNPAELTGGEITLLGEAWNQNSPTYTDPNPNCTPP